MTDHGTARFVGRSMQRREDHRLLTGHGQFIADLALPRMLHAIFVRSSVAHARIRSVDLSRAAAMPGVVSVLSGADLERIAPPVPGAQVALPSKWRTQVRHTIQLPQQPLLAVDKVRHVGEAIAVIVAESRYQAQDAAELVTIDLEALPAVVDAVAALEPGSALVHEQFQTNLIGEFVVAKGDAGAALDARSAQIASPLLFASLYRRAYRVPRRGQRLRPANRFRHDLVGDTGGAFGSSRGSSDPATAGVAGALPGARRRRRLWREGTCLSRGPGDPDRGPPGRPPGALDRGAAGTFHQRHPLARPTA